MADGPRRFTGQVVHDPAMAAAAEARREYISGSIHNFLGALPVGDHGSAPDAVPTTQPDRMCFYASIGGIAHAINGRATNLQRLEKQAVDENMLVGTGAQTHPEFRDRQVDFVRRHFSLDIQFIDNLRHVEAIDALTNGLVRGKPVVFGLPHHWVALDGIRKRPTIENSSWTGMNPHPTGRRIELGPGIIISRLIQAHMPLVVVEGASDQSRRMTGRVVQATDKPRFSGKVVEPSPPPRFKGRGTGREAPKFRPSEN
jgi:hypothetical protein